MYTIRRASRHWTIAIAPCASVGHLCSLDSSAFCRCLGDGQIGVCANLIFPSTGSVHARSWLR